MTQARRVSRCTQVQKEFIISFMARHRGLGLNAYSSNMGHQRHQELWAQIAQELSELGPSKTVDQWKTTWRDLKARAKKGNAAVYRAQRSTGNSQAVPVLSIADDAILSVIGKTSSEGLPGIPESGLGDGVNLPEPSTSAEMTTFSSTNAEVVIEPVEEAPAVHHGRPTTINEDLEAPTGRHGNQRIKKDLGGIYESCSNSLVNVLTDISNHLGVRNNIEEERNLILKRKNELLERLLTQSDDPGLYTTLEDD